MLRPIVDEADVNQQLIVYEEDKKKKKQQKKRRLTKKKRKRMESSDEDSELSSMDSSSSMDSDSDEEEEEEEDDDFVVVMPTLQGDDDADDADKDPKDKRKVKARKQTYLSIAIQRLPFNPAAVETFPYDPVQSDKYKVIELLVQKGAKLEVRREMPVMIQLVRKCQDDQLFQSGRFEHKYATQAGDADHCMGFQLMRVLLRCADNVDLNVVDKPKHANAKPLATYLLRLIRAECTAQQEALSNVMNRINAQYAGRDQRVVEHKKKLNLQRVRSIPIISLSILRTLLAFKGNGMDIRIDEHILLEATFANVVFASDDSLLPRSTTRRDGPHQKDGGPVYKDLHIVIGCLVDDLN